MFFDVSSQFGAQIHPDVTSNENYGCKGRSGQGMEEARDNSSMGIGKSQEQEGGYSGSTKRQTESPLRYTDEHRSSQKLRS